MLPLVASNYPLNTSDLPQSPFVFYFWLASIYLFFSLGSLLLYWRVDSVSTYSLSFTLYGLCFTLYPFMAS